MINILKNKELIVILLVSFLVRIIAAYFYGEGALINEWGTLIHNFEQSGTMGIFVQINEFSAIDKLAKPGERVLPSAFMPPLYFYFIYIIKIFSHNFLNFINVIIFFQIILSIASIILFFKIINLLGNNKYLNLLIISIFSFFPLYIYSVVQISSISLQMFLFLGFIYFLFVFNKKKNTYSLIFFSIFSGLLILTRGEFYLFYILAIIYFFLFLEKNIKSLVISMIISLIIISPYLYRNYTTFNSFTMTKSLGFNLLKGNNPTFKVEGNSDFIIENFNSSKINIKTENNYEILLDNYYKKKAITFIKEDPSNYLRFYFKKVFSYTFIDLNSSYDNYYNIIHILPKVLISTLGLVSAVFCLRKKGFYQFMSFYYFANILLFSVFFILPRYSVILLPINLLLIMETIYFLRRKL